MAISVTENSPPGAITGVLLLRTIGNRDDRDFVRATMLFDSLAKFASPGLFERIFIITPHDEVEIVSERLGPWAGLPLQVVDENAIEPDLARVPDISGWTRQQILKLSVSRHVDTAHYISFDADVICTHPIDRNLLLPEGKGLIQLLAKNEMPNRSHWWRSAARILGLPARLDEPGMTPTPAILATEVSRDLMRRLDHIADPKSWIDMLVGPLRDSAWQQYIPMYKHYFRWSEYSLYYLHCRDAGHFDRYHIVGGTRDIPQLLLSQASIWANECFEAFDGAAVFSEQDPALFCVVQSAMEIDPQLLRPQLEPFFQQT